MIADAVTLVLYAFKYFRVFPDIVPDTKECCFCLVVFQSFQDKICNIGYRPVVKGQINDLLVPVLMPGKRWVIPF